MAKRGVALLLMLLMVFQLIPSLEGKAETNITIKTEILAGSTDKPISDALSGSTFRVEVTYTLLPNSSSNTYNGTLITIPIPDGVEVIDLQTPGNADVVNGQGTVVTIQGQHYAIYELKKELAPGNARQVGFRARFTNMDTPNNATASFAAQIYGQYIPDPDNPENQESFDITSDAVSIQALAGDDWNVSKSVDASEEKEDGYFYVRYKLTAELADGAAYDRNGRLELDKYILKDTLPQNTQADGGATLVSVTGEGMTLAENNGYTVETNQDGSLKSITFTKYATQAEEGSYVPAGTSVRSTYYVTVKYPKTPYESPSNQEIQKYLLTNNAKLTYSLKTVDSDVNKESSADVELGWKENLTDAVSLKVQKNLSVAGQSFPLDDHAVAGGYEKASFSLYTDAECSQPAKDINGSTLTPVVRQTDSRGQVVFPNLRYGTYYLKEVGVPSGFEAPAANPLRVTLDANGNIDYAGITQDEKNNKTIQVINQSRTGGKGIVELYKKGLSASGETVALSGVTFVLKQGNTIVQTKQSDERGYVRFDAVDAGTYQIAETALPDSLKEEYAILSTEKTVTVAGNDIVRPASDVPGEEGVILNTSEKGRFKLVKTEDVAPYRPIAGAKFALFKSDTQPAAGDQPIQTFSVPQGGYVSDALTPGTYWVKETKAPEGYKITNEWTSFTVAKNSLATVSVQNEKRAVLAIKKYGSWNGDDHYEGLDGVAFQVYSSETATQPIATLVSTVDATGVPIYIDADTGEYTTAAALFDVGTYYLEEVESTLPEGYGAHSGRIPVSITKEDAYSDTGVKEIEIINHANYARIQITKKQSTQPYTLLKGAEFTIYDDAGCTHVVTTITTNDQGAAISGLLPVTDKKYYIKETKVPEGGYFKTVDVINAIDAQGNGYHSDEADAGLTLTANTQMSLVVTNDKAATIELLKKDKANSASGETIWMQDVAFGIYDRNPDTATPAPRPIEIKRTGADGKAAFMGLEPGKTYWIKEQSTPEGYVSNSTPIEVVAPTATENLSKQITVENERYATVKVLKTGLFDGATVNLSGATILLYPYQTGNAEQDKLLSMTGGIKTGQTGSDGIASFANITPGRYWVEESAAPQGYALNTTPTWIDVQSGDNVASYRSITHASIDNQPNMGKVKVRKVSSTDETKGLTAGFELREVLQDGSVSADVAATITTSAGQNNGYGTSGWLAPGTYQIVEVSVEGNYVKDAAPRQIEVVEGQTTGLAAPNDIVFENKPMGKFKIIKTASWSIVGENDIVRNVNGAVFEAYPKSASGTPQSDREQAVENGTLISDLRTTNDGTVTSEFLAPGDYWIIETQAPEGYTKDETPRSVTVVPEDTKEIVVNNTPEKGRIKLYKRDLINHSILLGGADFELYYRDDVQGTVQEGLPGVKLVKASEQKSLQSGTEEKELGTALTVELEPGREYYLKELDTSILIQQDGYRMQEQWTGPIAVTAASVTKVDIYNYKPATPPGAKVDQDGAPLSGAVMGIFSSQAQAAEVNRNLESGTLKLTDAQLADADYLATLGVLQTKTSSATGEFRFDELVPGQTYYVVELKAPQPNDEEEYVRANHVYSVTVKDDGTAFESDLIIENLRYGQIQVLKKTTLSGQDYLLDGAEFSIYPAKLKENASGTDNGDHVCTEDCLYEKAGNTPAYIGTTGTDSTRPGSFLSGLLRPGNYIVEETKAPEGFEATTECYHVQVTSNTINVYLSDGTGGHPVYNKALYGRFQLRKHDAADIAPAVTHLKATFRMEQWDSAQGKFVPYIATGDTEQFTFTTDGKGDYLSGYLPANRYKLIETSVQEGYTAGAEIEINVTGGEISALYEVTNPKQGSVVIEKYASFMGARGQLMDGVEFSIYHATPGGTEETDCVGTAVKTGATVGGRLQITNLDAGDYWVKETSIGSGNSGFEANAAAKKIHIDPGESVQLTLAANDAFINVPVYGKLKITKVDAVDGTPLSGAVFHIYGNKECTGTVYGTITTGSDGTGVSSSLLDPQKKYWVKEVTTPSGYMPSGSGIYGPYEVTANGYNTPETQDIRIANNKEQIVSLHKVSKNAEGVTVPLSGATFALYDSREDAQNLQGALQTKSTDGSGNIRFTGLLPNTEYFVRETNVPVGYVDNTQKIYSVTTTNSGSAAFGEIVNIPQGRIQLKKIARWTDSDGQQSELLLKGASFNIYRWDGAFDTGSRGDYVSTITTNDQGMATSGYLDPGNYVLEEATAPADFALAGENSFKLEVRAGKDNTDYVATPILNVPEKGRFEVEKFVAGSDPHTRLSGAVFELYKKVGDGYVYYNDQNKTFTVNGTYLSGYLPAGEYMIKEVTAPNGYTLDQTECCFEVKVGETTYIPVENNAQARIELTKKSDVQNGSVPLAGAKFQLYLGDPAAGGIKVGQEKQTDSAGKIIWEHLDAGTYYLVETQAPDGYTLDGTIQPIVVAKKGTAEVYPGSVVNKSNKGRILIKKQDAENLQRLDGAVFEIWSVNAQEEPLECLQQNVTTNATGLVLTDLLPASSSGTKYLVKEVRAPEGYMLDDRVSQTQQIVTVYPLHDPQEDSAQLVTFDNRKQGTLTGFPSQIQKSIRSNSDLKSLMLQDFEITFKLTGYTNGQNPVAMDGFTVSDTGFAMFYLDGSEKKPISIQKNDYRIDKVRVYRAYNEGGGQVDAVVEYQTYEQLGTGQWTALPSDYKLTKLNELGAGEFQTVNLVGIDESIMSVRVRYSGVKEKFNAEGLELDAVFQKREGGADVHEVRRIENTAKLSYSYKTYNEGHIETTVPVEINSNMVYRELPLMEVVKTEVHLSNIAENSGNTFVAGNPVKYNVTATNLSASDADFVSPIIAIDLPAYTTLDETFNNNQRFVIRDGTGRLLTPTNIGYEEVQATYMNPSSGQREPLYDEQGKPVMTKRLTFIFDGHTMAKNDEIVISYQAVINVNKPSGVTELFSPAYLSSAYRLPVTIENPLGLSFDNAYPAGGLVENDGLDSAVDSMLGEEALGENRYVNANESIYVTNDTALSIYKQVKGALDQDYLNAGQVAYTYPNGAVSYKVTVTNGAFEAKNLKVVDILPFYGDSYVLRNESTGASTARSTELRRRPTLTGVNAPGATVYYYTGDFSNRSGGVQQELPMLYGNEADSWNGWTTTPSDLSQVTAIGIQCDFPDDALMKKGDTYSFEITMQMPGFTADEINQFYDKLVANSAATALTDANSSQRILQTENNQVVCRMRLPMGKIGDYVFNDVNENGIQDAGDQPIANLGVTLYRTDVDVSGNRTNYTLNTTTDTDGKYIFNDLPCNLLKQGAQAGSTNPSDYVGEVYTYYRVVFADPGNDFAPTLRYAGEDGEKDSDIDARLSTEQVTLSVTDHNGTLVGEENLSLDAGFVLPAALGDRVWLDQNKNGVQDPSEKGVNGVTVNLYRVENGTVSDTLYATTQTATRDGEDGMYRFDQLVPGEYVVEFDISGLMKEDGYTYRYAFTKPKATASSVDDSDAQKTMDTDDRIRRTEVIPLAPQQTDLNWDAGLTAYSALGGYCFDDVNYSDVQDVGVALPGTVVTLYRVVDGIREKVPCRDSVTVGMDGRYYFDQLDEGQYQVHFDFPDRYQAVAARKGTDRTLDSDVEVELDNDLNSGYTRVIELGYDSVDTTWDAGACLLGSIGDYVWFDTDKDGIQDPTEKGVEGVEVILQRRGGMEGLWEFYARDTTDAEGKYLFTELKGGLDAGYLYRVIFAPKDAMALTVTNEGEDHEMDSDAMPIYIGSMGYPTNMIQLGYGETDLSWDAGLVNTTGILGDYVWFDTNKNGVQDDGETGIAGIKVVLEHNASGKIEDEDAWKEIAETATNRGGYYRFENLNEGYYRVKFGIPTEYTVTQLEATDQYELDSDGITPARNGYYYTRAIYLEAEGYDMSWDCGVYTGRRSVRTGDGSHPFWWLFALAVSGGVLAASLGIKRKRSHRDQ